MKRREFIALAGAAAAWPMILRAQQPGKVWRVGFLGLPSADSLPQRTEAFRTGLREHGYREGHDIVIEYRWADSNYERLPALLAELVRLNVDVIVTHGTPGALAAKGANLTTPVVIAVVGDAVASGAVASLARPGGNITGLTFFQPELNVKRIELLKEAVPDLTNVGVLLNSTNQMNAPVLPQVAEVVRHLGMELHQFAVHEPAGFDAAFADMAARGVGGLVIFDELDADRQRARDRRARHQGAAVLLRLSRLRLGRRTAGLWRGFSRHVPALGDLCGQDFEGRQTRRPAGRAGDQVHYHSQCGDGQIDGADGAAVPAAARRRSDRMKRREFPSPRGRLR